MKAARSGGDVFRMKEAPILYGWGPLVYLSSLLDSMVAGRSTRRWNASATSRHSATSSTGRNAPRAKPSILRVTPMRFQSRHSPNVAAMPSYVSNGSMPSSATLPNDTASAGVIDRRCSISTASQISLDMRSHSRGPRSSKTEAPPLDHSAVLVEVLEANRPQRSHERTRAHARSIAMVMRPDIPAG